MLARQDFNSLIHNIQDLYHKLSLYLFNIRKQSGYSVANKKPHDINKVISKHINLLVKESKKKSLNQSTAPPVSKDYVVTQHVNNNVNKNQEHIVSTGIDTHVDHYKFKKESSDINPAIKEQLSKNTWLHIHAAIRNARQGKQTEARLYGELANNALKEAAHYMSEDEYLEFTSSIDNELNKLKSNS
jgi:methyl coenzyme M reductase subunit C-like uncharacterized protein (methanogenesis marker protein 7)